MDTKQFFTSVSFAIVTTMLINYFIIDRFFNKDTQEIKSGQAFHVTPLEQMNKPLATEVNFIDEDTAFFSKNEPELTKIVTPLADIVFSSRGATISNLTCKRVSGHVETPLEIISSGATGASHSFLVAFDDTTPLNYSLIDKSYQEGIHTLTYESQSALGMITKTFKLYDDNYKIDLLVTIDPRTTLNPRMLFTAPKLAGLGKDYDTALVNSQKNSIQRLKMNDLVDKAFAMPTLCGGADRYFINAFIKSAPTFAQRCYFVTKDDLLECIVEGPEVSTKSSWELSWYCGPKEFESLQASDPRLTELLDYGWFAPLARPLLFLLKYLYNFVHNFGLAIIILTILLNLALLPFTARGDKILQKTTDFSKKMQYLEQKYKHDKERLAQEKSELIQKHGAFDALGCVSFLLQTIFFIGLNKVLSASVELYHAPFFGWITDLSVKDPYYLLPLCVFLGIVIPTLNTSGDIRQKATTFAMGLFICGIVAQLSAGLALFIVTNVLTRVVVTRVKKMLK
jgi:YidC/Oxa1 family membrane protein insertase